MFRPTSLLSRVSTQWYATVGSRNEQPGRCRLLSDARLVDDGKFVRPRGVKCVNTVEGTDWWVVIGLHWCRTGFFGKSGAQNCNRGPGHHRHQTPTRAPRHKGYTAMVSQAPTDPSCGVASVRFDARDHGQSCSTRSASTRFVRFRCLVGDVNGKAGDETQSRPGNEPA